MAAKWPYPYGTVIRFPFGSGIYTAMVLLTSTEYYLLTDEGTAFGGAEVGGPKMIVLGLTVPDNRSKDVRGYHEVGKTATHYYDPADEVLT